MTGPSTQDGGRTQAQREIGNSQSPSSTNGWNHSVADAYNAERSRLEREQAEKNKKSW